MPLVLGGDHSIAIGTLGGLARAARRARRRHLAGRAHRHQLAVDLAQRQRARHAAGGGAGPDRRPALRGPRPGRCRWPTTPARCWSASAASTRGERAQLRRVGVHVFTIADIDRLRHARRDGARRSSSPPAARSCTSRSTWTCSTPTRRPASARRCGAASPTARRTWRWRCSPRAALMTLARGGRGEPGAGRAQRDRQPGRRAGALSARRAHPLDRRSRRLPVVVDGAGQLVGQVLLLDLARRGSRAGTCSRCRGRAWRRPE